MLCLANGFGGDSDSEQDKKGRASPKVGFVQPIDDNF